MEFKDTINDEGYLIRTWMPVYPKSKRCMLINGKKATKKQRLQYIEQVNKSRPKLLELFCTTFI